MDGKAEFDAAVQYLNGELDRLKHRDWKQSHLNLENLQPEDAWSFLNELLQNAVDFNANNIRIKYENDKLIFQHDADVKRHPLDRDSIKGLCGIGESTKGLQSVGFMGIGFKFFIRFFSKVTICDGHVQFCMSFNPNDKDPTDHYKSLYRPTWVKSRNDISQGYSTAFIFEEPFERTSGQLQEAFDDIDTKRFTTLAHEGLKSISIQERVFSCDVNQNKAVKITCEDEEWNYLILKREIEMSEEATDALRAKRLPPKQSGNNRAKRSVRLIAEFQRNKDTTKLVLKPEKRGRLYCLVPLGDNLSFPFKIGLDADWFMPSDRKSVNNDARAQLWHHELVSRTLPSLLSEYLSTLDNSGEDRKKCTDIFPKLGPYKSDYQYSPAFQFLGDSDFLGILKVELEKCKFVLCADGNTRKPTEVRRIPVLPVAGSRRPDFDEPMSEKTASHIINKCFTKPIMEPSAIAQDAVTYLEKELQLFEFPVPSEIVVDEIRSLWDKENPSEYHHVLDVLSEMVPKDEQGLEVVPLSNDKWGPLYGPKLVFEHVPKGRGVEQPLFDLLKNKMPEIEDCQEVHESLFGKKKNKKKKYSSKKPDVSGNTWKDKKMPDGSSLFDRALKISKPIKKLGPLSKLAEVKAIFRFAMRAEKPRLITHLHTKKGIKPAEECIISPPFADGNIAEIAPDLAISDDLNELMKKLPGKMSAKREMMMKTGAMHLVPKKWDDELDDASEVTKFLGTKVGIDGVHVSTWAGDFSGSGIQRGWTIHEFRWPIKFDRLEMITLSQYLSEPNKDLKESLTAAKKQRWGTYFNNGNHRVKGLKDANWFTELRDSVWVKCSDDRYRKPSNSPPLGSGNPCAVMDLDTLEFYSDLGIKFDSEMDDLNPEECFKTWTTKPVLRNKLFLKKLDELDKLDAEKLDILSQILWPSHGENYSQTPLSNFVHKPQSDLGGFIGDADKIGEHEMEVFESIGMQFPSTITPNLAADFIRKISTEDNPREIFEKHEGSLQAAWKIILEGDFDITNIPVLDSEFNWHELSQYEAYYVQLVHDENRQIDIGAPLLLHLQFHPSVVCMRELYDSTYPIALLDNELELSNEGETNQSAINLSRIAFSMDLDYLFYHLRSNEECKFELDSVQVDYLIKDENGIVKLYFSDKNSSWKEEFSQLLINQKPVRFHRFGAHIRKAMETCDNGSFEQTYRQLCKQANLQFITFDEGEVRYGAIGDIKEPEAPITRPKVSVPASVKIAEEKTRDEIEREQNKATKKKSESEKNDGKTDQSGSVITEEQIPENGVSKRSNRISNSQFTADDVGDQAEKHVADNLKRNGWKVTMMKKNNPGYDISATKDEVERRIEVKGTERNWGRIQITHQQGMHFFKTVDEDKGEGKIEYWLCVVEYVLTEDLKDYNTEVYPKHPEGVTIHPINLSKAKPKHAFTKTSWTNRIKPDRDW